MIYFNEFWQRKQNQKKRNMNTRKLSSVVTVFFKTLVRVAVQALTVQEAFNPVTPKT